MTSLVRGSEPLPTNVNLFNRKMVSSSDCSLCRSWRESALHAIWDCIVSGSIWEPFLFIIRGQFVLWTQIVLHGKKIIKLGIFYKTHSFLIFRCKYYSWVGNCLYCGLKDLFLKKPWWFQESPFLILKFPRWH